MLLLFIKKINVGTSNSVINGKNRCLLMEGQLVTHIIIKMAKHSILVWAILNFSLFINLYSVSGEAFTYCYELLSADQYILIVKIIVSFFV